MSDTSGSVSTSGYNGRYLTFSWSVSSQSVENNQTTISWELYGDGPEWVESDATFYLCRNVSVKISDASVYTSGQDNPVELRSGTTVASGTYTLTHESDGSKAFSVSVDAAIYEWSDNVSAYDEWILPTIARASQPSINSFPNNSPDFNLGDTITIHMNRKSSAFTHNVYFYWGTNWVEVATGVTNNCTFNTKTGQLTVHKSDGTTYTIESLYHDWTNGWTANMTTVTGYIYVSTWNGSTNIGYKTCNYVCHLVNMPPTISGVTITDDNAGSKYPGGTLSAIEGSKYIQGYSKVHFKVSAKSNYGATITKWTITLNGQAQTGLGDGVYTNLGNGKWSVVVTDSRGYTASTSGTLSVITYKQLTLDAAGISRSGSDNTKALINLSGAWHNGSLGAVNNALTITYSGAASGSLTPTNSGNTYKVSGTQVSGTYAISSTYALTVTVKDKLSTISRTLTLYEQLPVVAYFKNHFDVFGNLHIHDRNNEGNYGVITPTIAEWLNAGIEIPSTADMNNYKTTGFYRIAGTAPANANGCTWAHVVILVSGSGVTQIIIQHGDSSGKVWLRWWQGSPAAWTSWALVSKTWNGLIDDHSTYNASDTWIPVFSGSKVQHTLPATIRELSNVKFSNLSNVTIGYGKPPLNNFNSSDFFYIIWQVPSNYKCCLYLQLFSRAMGYCIYNPSGTQIYDSYIGGNGLNGFS